MFKPSQRLLVLFPLAITFAWSILAISSASLDGKVSYVASASFMSLLLAAILPKVAAYLFLASLAVFGNKPGSLQSYYLLLIASGLNLGFLIHFFRKEGKELFKIKESKSNFLIFLSSLYVLVSFFSLSALPLKELASGLTSRFPELSLKLVTLNTVLFSRLTEISPSYAALSFIQTCYAFSIAYFIYKLVLEDRNCSIKIALSILAGLLVSFFFGLLDYYGPLDLRFMRELDPTANAGNIQFRIQSFFGHSGWFAEYITLTIPFVIPLMLIKRSFLFRISLILSILLLGEFILVLTYQRGGWLSYPLTLVGVWSAIYITRCIERGNSNFVSAFKSSLKKIIISIPITVAFTLFVISFIQVSHEEDGESYPLVARYVTRFWDIKKTSDRTDFIEAGFLIGAEHPIYGGGSESFAYQYEKEFEQPDGKYYKRFNLPLHGSAHNVYMQTFAGKGAVGLCMLLLIIAVMINNSMRIIIQEKDFDYKSQLVLLSSTSFAIAFLIYGLVQEVFYIQPLQYLFFAVVALCAGVANSKITASEGSRNILLNFIMLAFLAHLSWEYIYPGKARAELWGNREAGCYQGEKDEKGNNFSWCGPQARVIAKVEDNKAKLAINAHPGIQKGKFILTVKTQDEVTLFENPIPVLKRKNIEVEIPKSLELRDGQIPLTIQANNYFVPSRSYPNSKDRRVLSYRFYR